MSKPNNRCARCGRATFSPAVVIGTQPFGPVCARKAELIEPKRRRHPRPRPKGGRMKPHFRKVLGIWHCGIRGIPNKRIGVGYTPRQAYQDWLWENNNV